MQVTETPPNATTRATHAGSVDCRKVSQVLARIGDKWTVLIVRALGDGPRRFNELKRLVGGISQRMLTLTLKGLERDGMVTRIVTPSIPPRVDYELTDLGHSLLVPVGALGEWALANAPLIEAARARFDRARRQGTS
jgi:DNA-binding HxlR family transcriptional regulator